jgi:hypothetical protein
MSEPGWKTMLREPHAIGWIGLIVLVFLIGIGALYFGNNGANDADHPPTSQTAK